MKQTVVAIGLGWIVMVGCAPEDVAAGPERFAMFLEHEDGQTAESGMTCSCAVKHATGAASDGDAGEHGHACRCAHHDGGACPHHTHDGAACACHGTDSGTAAASTDAGTHTHGP